MYFRPQAKTYDVGKWLPIRFGKTDGRHFPSLNDRANGQETMREKPYEV
jgi:hypothetical protein